MNDAIADWGLMQVYLAIAEVGSLGQAAQKLGLSQPTLSRRLAQLEASLGQAVFERSPQGVQLTPAGAALLEPAQRMREAVGQVGIAMERHNRSVAGTVRITASEVVSHFVLPPVLRQLRQNLPQVQLELVPNDNVADLIKREADIAIRMFRPSEPGLITRRLADMPVGLYAHSSYLAQRGPVASHTMHLHDWVGMDQQTTMIQGFAAAGHPVAREFFAVRTDSGALAWQAVCAGLGIGVGIDRVAQSNPQLVRVLPEVTVPSLQAWLTTHRELHGTPRLRRVFGALADALGL